MAHAARDPNPGLESAPADGPDGIAGDAGARQRQFFGASGCLSGAAFWNASSRIAAS